MSFRDIFYFNFDEPFFILSHTKAKYDYDNGSPSALTQNSTVSEIDLSSTTTDREKTSCLVSGTVTVENQLKVENASLKSKIHELSSQKAIAEAKSVKAEQKLEKTVS